MEEIEKEMYKQECVYLCNRLSQLSEKNAEEASSFFNGEILTTYCRLNESAINKIQDIQRIIKNL